MCIKAHLILALVLADPFLIPVIKFLSIKPNQELLGEMLTAASPLA
jgi:hypothetical protein